MHKNDAEQLIAVIKQQTTAQEKQLGELNEHVNDVKEYLALIAGQLSKIAKKGD
jgi:uncharacterized coiled-coil protein SlyX